KGYNKSLKDLHGEFSHQITDFDKFERSLTLVSCPLTFDYEMAAQELHLELIDLQCDATLKEEFHNVKLDEFYATLKKAVFPHICEQTFNLININKSRHRSQLSDHHLSCVSPQHSCQRTLMLSQKEVISCMALITQVAFLVSFFLSDYR
ncbi:GTD2B protein, partial [Atractosteus spatula]|nr:GTD2B protein [Atractosteus spatula]